MFLEPEDGVNDQFGPDLGLLDLHVRSWLRSRTCEIPLRHQDYREVAAHTAPRRKIARSRQCTTVLQIINL